MSKFKNFITGGNYGKLENEKIDFDILRNHFLEFQDEYIAINQQRLNALSFLQHERTEVVKNLSMAKTLLSKIKSIRKDEIQKVETDAITYFENKDIEFTDGTITVDFQGQLDNLSGQFVSSLDSSFKRLNENKTYTKKDLKNEAAIVAIEALFSGVSALFTLNSGVNENRKKILNATVEIKNAMPIMTKQALKVYAEVNRIIEISKMLNKHNAAFSKKYNEMYLAMNKKSKFSLFLDEVLNRKIEPDEKMINDMQSLRMLSSEYNKFNKSAKM